MYWIQSFFCNWSSSTTPPASNGSDDRKWCKVDEAYLLKVNCFSWDGGCSIMDIDMCTGMNVISYLIIDMKGLPACFYPLCKFLEMEITHEHDRNNNVPMTMELCNLPTTIQSPASYHGINLSSSQTHGFHIQ